MGFVCWSDGSGSTVVILSPLNEGKLQIIIISLQLTFEDNGTALRNQTSFEELIGEETLGARPVTFGTQIVLLLGYIV